jgi:tetratricopeptide (TPR) repeat protein
VASRPARHRYCRCGTHLAADNPGRQCARCERAVRDKLIAPPQVPSEFWQTEHFRAAFTAQHMGWVARTYRTHPYHHAVYGPSGISQTLLGQWLGLRQPQVSRIETGPPIRDLDTLVYWAQVLGIPAGLLWFRLPDDNRLITSESAASDVAYVGPNNGFELPSLRWASDPTPLSIDPIDEAFIASIHTRMGELLALDAQLGGNETSAQALRLFRSVHRRIGVSPCPKRLQRDVYAAVGELAEIAGWLFYDANQQDAMRRINQEALYYLRWAGHRNLELLTLQNISMQAEYLNRPSEALNIVQSVLDTDRLSPRMESLFLARGAHALAQRQQQAEALRTFQKARALYLDGPREDDPAWASWVDDRQFAWFEAMIWTELGRRDKPVHIFTEALATSPKHRVRGLYSRSVYLFGSLVNVGDWREAELLVPKLAPYIGEVGSGRTVSILRQTLHTVRKTETTPTLEDGVVWLQRLLGCREPGALD